jgi:xanthine dehydrogenase accessory factor
MFLGPLTATVSTTATSEWSDPETAVLDRASDLHAAGRRAVLVTLVDVEGSAYRRPGAKLLVPAEGDGSGAITAGCLEGHLHNLAEEVFETGAPRVETFDLRDDEEAWGLGIGCDGVVDVLLEPLDDSFGPALSAHEAGEHCTVLTVLDADGMALGDRACYREESGLSPVRGEWPDWLRDRLTDTAAERASDGQSETITVEGPDATVTVFVDGIAPPPRLLVVGTGNDVAPVVDLAARAGFRVEVAGYRGGRADADRFPGATSVVSTSPAAVDEAVAVGADTYVVVMTHNFVDDRLTLETLLDTGVPYVGIVGSRGRLENLFEALDTEAEPDSVADRMYAPAGLDLGGDTPAQVALSIVSEVLAVHNDRTGDHLRDRPGTIHDRPSENASHSS